MIQDSASNQVVAGKSVYVVSSNPNVNDLALLDLNPLYNTEDPLWDLEIYEGGSVSFNALANSFDDEGPLTLIDFWDSPTELVADWYSDGSVTLYAADNFITDHQRWEAPSHFFVEDSGDVLPAEMYYGDYWPIVLPVNDSPVAVTETVYAAPGATIDIRPLLNDTDPEGDQPFITDVDAGLFGTPTFTAGTISLTVDPNTSTNFTIEYEIKDGYGGVTTGSITVNLVKVTGYEVERQLDDGSWIPEPGQLWSIDTLRWKAELNVQPELPVQMVEWNKAFWPARDDPSAYNVFAWSLASLAWAEGTPGTGNWAIRPNVVFDGNAVQSGFVATLINPPQEVVAEILEVYWFGIDPGDGLSNLYNDNPQNLGGGWRIFPDANEFNGPSHREVLFGVRVSPNVAGIVVPVKLFDADDPTSQTGPIDDDGASDQTSDYVDNFGDTQNFPATVTTELGLLTTAIGTDTFLVDRNPGDNYRVVAAPREEDFGKLRPMAPDSEGRLYRDTNGGGQHEDGEPILDENTPYAPKNITVSPLLTVWRRLNVEVDSWGAPPAEVVYNPDDDPVAGDIPDPDIDKLDEALAEAFIEVVQFENTYNESGLDWELQDDPAFANQPGVDNFTELVTHGESHRQSQESEWFWSSYTMGIYEFGDFIMESTYNTRVTDNDGDDEGALMGYNPANEPETAFVAMEILRDVTEEPENAISQNDLNQFVTVHEIGHQFGLVHSPGAHVMVSPANDADEELLHTLPIKFSDGDLKTIRDETPDGENDGP